jgi:hypothetical protein
MTFTNDSDVEIAAGTTETILFTAVDVGRIVIPSGSISAFDQQIDNISLITNQASTPGEDKTCYEQNYTTSSGQIIPIKYDTAEETLVHVKIYIQKGAETGDQITNQLKKDLIKSSANWMIGQNITSLITSVPFDECTYTTVAYTQVSTDGVTWRNIIEVPANSIPRVTDETIDVQELTS